jgi:phage baseplate assembly protein W
MAWLAPSLPLRKSTETGYVLVKDYTKLVKQNFKNLLLTIPGERMMDPNFGIGIKRFLFEIDSPLLYDRISSKVRQQVNRYLPYLDIENIIFNSATEDPTMDLNSLGVIIEYRIVPLELSDQLEITTIVD